MFAHLVDMKEEYGEVNQDDDDEGQDEDDGQRGEDPQQVLQNTQVVLPCMEHTHLGAKTDGSILRTDASQQQGQSLLVMLHRVTLASTGASGPPHRYYR